MGRLPGVDPGRKVNDLDRQARSNVVGRRAGDVVPEFEGVEDLEDVEVPSWWNDAPPEMQVIST